MKRFWPKPTFRETARYLDAVLDELKKKHGASSGENFERDLVALTGIGSRQVRTYKNGPNQGQRLKENSLVLKFVLEARKKDTRRKVRIGVLNLVMFLGIGGFIGWLIFKPTPIQSFGIREVRLSPQPTDRPIVSKINLKIAGHPWVLRTGPLKALRLDRGRLSCTYPIGQGFQNCNFIESDSNGSLQFSIILDGEIVKTYTIITTRPTEVESIRRQLRAQFDSFKPAAQKGTQLHKQEFKVGDEKVNILSSPEGPGWRPAMTVTVSLSAD